MRAHVCAHALTCTETQIQIGWFGMDSEVVPFELTPKEYGRDRMQRKRIETEEVQV